MNKSVSAQAMEYIEAPVSKKVRPAVAVKEIERYVDQFNFGRLFWYVTKRYKFQLSVLINAYFIGAPLVRFFHQFLV